MLELQKDASPADTLAAANVYSKDGAESSKARENDGGRIAGSGAPVWIAD
jgi:hypothetical protein